MRGPPRLREIIKIGHGWANAVLKVPVTLESEERVQIYGQSLWALHEAQSRMSMSARDEQVFQLSPYQLVRLAHVPNHNKLHHTALRALINKQSASGEYTFLDPLIDSAKSRRVHLAFRR